MRGYKFTLLGDGLLAPSWPPCLSYKKLSAVSRSQLYWILNLPYGYYLLGKHVISWHMVSSYLLIFVAYTL